MKLRIIREYKKGRLGTYDHFIIQGINEFQKKHGVAEAVKVEDWVYQKIIERESQIVNTGEEIAEINNYLEEVEKN